LNAPLFGDVRAASDAALIVLVLVLELALAVVESEADRPMAEALSSGVLVSFVVVVVATCVGEGAAAAAPAGFYCVYACVCVSIYAFVCVYADREHNRFSRAAIKHQASYPFYFAGDLAAPQERVDGDYSVVPKIWICGNRPCRR